MMKHRLQTSFLPLLLASALGASGLAAESLPGAPDHGFEGPLRVASSHRLLQTELGSEFGWRADPIAATLPSDGRCLAWFDARQGGSIMATRVSATGEILDPAGIPLDYGWYREPAAIVPTGSGCVVFSFRTHPQVLTGTFLPESGGEPEVRFRLDLPGTPSAYLADRESLYLFFPTFDSSRVWKLSTSGIETGIFPKEVRVTDAVRAGDHIYLLSGGSTLWRMSAGLTATRLLTIIPTHSVLRLFADEDGLLIASVRGRHLEVVRYDTEGTIRSWFDTDLDHGGEAVDLIEHDGRLVLIMNLRDGGKIRTLLLDVTAEIEPVGSYENATQSYAGGTGSNLFVHTTQETTLWEGTLRMELTPGLPTGEGEPLTTMPAPEVVIDVAHEGDQVALLWATVGDEQNRLYVGFPTEANEIEPVEIGSVDLYSEASVAMKSGVTMVLWRENARLWTRRLGFDRQWIDAQPQLLAEAPGLRFEAIPGSIGHGSLAVVDDAWLVVWGDFEERSLMVATMTSDGISTRSLEFEPQVQTGTAVTPSTPAILEIGDRYVVAALNRTPAPCRITCPPPAYPLLVMQYDDQFRLQESVEPIWDASRYTLALVAGAESILALADYSGLVLRADRTGALESQTITTELDGQSAIWLDGKFVITGKTSDVLNAPFTRTMIFDPVTGAETWHSLVPDVSEGFLSLKYQPRLLSLGERLLLFGSEVSRDPAEGTVRRLRIHEIETGPAPVRNRPVRR